MINICRAESRFHTRLDWLDSRHSFSFGEHFDPANTHHGLLVASNENRVRPSSGFGSHDHRDMEIVTWVLSGRLEHADSEGNHDIIYPGLVQRMTAGTGISHSETNPSADEEVHFIQMWVPADTPGVRPSYEQRDVNGRLGEGGLHLLASGHQDSDAITIRQRNACFWAGRLRPSESAAIPEAVHTHLFVAVGRAWLDEEGLLGAGDAARISHSDGLYVVADSEGAEVLIWATV